MRVEIVGGAEGQNLFPPSAKFSDPVQGVLNCMHSSNNTTMTSLLEIMCHQGTLRLDSLVHEDDIYSLMREEMLKCIKIQNGLSDNQCRWCPLTLLVADSWLPLLVARGVV